MAGGFYSVSFRSFTSSLVLFSPFALQSIDLISDALPLGRLCYTEVDDAIEYAMHSSRSHDAVIRVYDAAGNVIETHENKRE